MSAADSRETNANHMSAEIVLDDTGPRHVTKKKIRKQKIVNHYGAAIMAERERSWNLAQRNLNEGACHVYRKKNSPNIEPCKQINMLNRSAYKESLHHLPSMFLPWTKLKQLGKL